MKRGMNLRAQISVFVIIGILVVAVAGGIGYGIKINRDARLSNEFFSQADIQPQVENIQSNIMYCAESISENSLITIGMQGGYYNKPAQYLNLGLAFIPYYYYEGDYLMPSRAEITNEIRDYVNDKMKTCLNEMRFDNFEISYGRIKTNVEINQEAVDFNIDAPIKIKRQGNSITFELKDSPVSINSALKDILEIAEYITESHKIDAKMYCVTCLVEMAEEKDVYIRTSNINDNDVLIMIGENRTSYEPYIFTFLNKYTGDEVKTSKFNFEGLDAPEIPINEEV